MLTNDGGFLMTTVRTRIARIALGALLVAGLVPTAALADDYTEGFGVNSFRYQDGYRIEQEEPVEEVDPSEIDWDALPENADELELGAAAGFVMWTRNGKGNYVSSNGKEIPGALRRGIDVSEWNGDIDWAKVKKDDVSFAIIRCGGTYMTSRKQYDDDTFIYNAKECERLGIPYGVYFFSTAMSASDAKKELDFTLKKLEGLHPTMPIYYDLEWEDVASVSNRKMLAEISTIFCEGIAAAGYQPGVYANTTWWENYLTDPCFDRWTKWVAQYYSRCEYTGTYDIWQCTSVATINGISGANNVDLNFDFRADWGQTGAWEKSGSTWKYKYADGTYASGSLVDIGGATYSFDSNKNALSGWQKVSGSWHYFDPSTRAMVRGWLADGSKWYWLDTTTGAMATGWALVGDTWYYFDADGVMKDGAIFTVNGVSYIAAEGGACPASSWVELNGKWYLTDASCALRKGWATVGGVKYYLDPKTFVMKAGETFTVDGVQYTAKASGAVSNGGSSSTTTSSTTSKAGWVQSGSRWWYRNADGSYPKNEFKTIGKSTYWFDASGWMATGWRQIGGKWYWFASSGAMKKNGWAGNYYLGSDGAMLTSTKTPDGYYVGADGAWLGAAGWRSSGNRWWYMNADGSYPANQWKMINGTWYWFDASGWMATGWKQIGGKWYWFASSGAMGSSRWVGNYYLGSDGAMLTSTTTPDGYKVGSDGAWVR